MEKHTGQYDTVNPSNRLVGPYGLLRRRSNNGRFRARMPMIFGKTVPLFPFE